MADLSEKETRFKDPPADQLLDETMWEYTAGMDAPFNFNPDVAQPWSIPVQGFGGNGHDMDALVIPAHFLQPNGHLAFGGNDINEIDFEKLAENFDVHKFLANYKDMFPSLDGSASARLSTVGAQPEKPLGVCASIDDMITNPPFEQANAPKQDLQTLVSKPALQVGQINVGPFILDVGLVRHSEMSKMLEDVFNDEVQKFFAQHGVQKAADVEKQVAFVNLSDVAGTPPIAFGRAPEPSSNISQFSQLDITVDDDETMDEADDDHGASFETTAFLSGEEDMEVDDDGREVGARDQSLQDREMSSEVTAPRELDNTKSQVSAENQPEPKTRTSVAKPKPQISGSKKSAVAAPLLAGSEPKRGRGRPIIEGSKRQQRIQAKAQPDYVPPRRGRPKQIGPRQKKVRVRRRRNRAPAAQNVPSGAPVNQVGQPLPAFLNGGPPQYAYVNEEVDTHYKPCYFILNEVQARKVAQVFGILEPEGGWNPRDHRWNLTYNLRRMTPKAIDLLEKLSTAASTTVKTSEATQRERQVEIDTEPEKSSKKDQENRTPSEGSQVAGGSSQKHTDPVNTGPTPVFDRNEATTAVPENNYVVSASEAAGRLLVTVGEGDEGQKVTRPMAEDEVFAKLLDERDVYFRAIVWEIMQGGQRLEGMTFVGAFDQMRGVFKFV